MHLKSYELPCHVRDESDIVFQNSFNEQRLLHHAGCFSGAQERIAYLIFYFVLFDNTKSTCSRGFSEFNIPVTYLNWQKTKVQALGSREDVPPSTTVLDQEVAMVEEFVYLGSLVHSSTQSSSDISRRNAITRAAMQNLDKRIWRSRITIPDKLKLYNTCKNYSVL